MRRSFVLATFIIGGFLVPLSPPAAAQQGTVEGSNSSAQDPRGGGTVVQSSSAQKPQPPSSAAPDATSSREAAVSSISSAAALQGRSSSSVLPRVSNSSIARSLPSSVSSSSRAAQSSYHTSSAKAAVSSAVRALPSSARLSSSQASSSEQSSNVTKAISAPTASGWFLRERLGYDVPIIDPAAVRHPSEISLSAEAVGGNLLLALLIALTLGTTGVIMRRLIATDEVRVKTILRRLPFQGVLTFVLIWIIELLIPSASAQGVLPMESVSLLRIPLYAVLFFVVVGTSNYLFNSMLTAEGDTLKLFSNEQGMGSKVWFIALLIVGYGLVGAHINPEFSLLEGRQLGIIIVASLALIFSVCFKDTILYGFARFWKMPGRFRANIGGFAIAVVCIALSRSFALNPGYIYGVPIGLLIVSRLYEKREGFFEFLGIVWLLILATVVWVLGEQLAAYPILFDLFTLLFVILAEDAFFELLPLPYLAGGTIFRWHRLAWLGLFTLAIFAVFHTLFNPQGTVMSLQESPPTLAAVLLLGSYAAGVFVLWGYIVWRRARDLKPEPLYKL